MNRLPWLFYLITLLHQVSVSEKSPVALGSSRIMHQSDQCVSSKNCGAHVRAQVGHRLRHQTNSRRSLARDGREVPGNPSFLSQSLPTSTHPPVNESKTRTSLPAIRCSFSGLSHTAFALLRASKHASLNSPRHSWHSNRRSPPCAFTRSGKRRSSQKSHNTLEHQFRYPWLQPYTIPDHHASLRQYLHQAARVA